MKKQILILGLAIISVLFSACSNKYTIKQSPCACYDVEVLQEDRG